jgi:steroid 5-alpha reductase family enzyme
MLLSLGYTLLAAICLMAVCWRFSLSVRDVSFIDAIWAFGMVYTVGIAAILAARPPTPAGWLLLMLVALWGLRLGTHLWRRWRRLGPDPRYQRIMAAAMDKQGMSFASAAWWRAFGLQGPLLWLVSLPPQAALLAGGVGALAGGDSGLAFWTGFGAILALLGIAFETVGDLQLEAFRQNPANRGRVLDTGLWRYTRHPNYFGDFVTWWGIFIVSVAGGAPWWTISGPLFLSFTLTRWSGAPMLEHSLKKRRPGYDDYIRRTSRFFPLPPKRG